MQSVANMEKSKTINNLFLVCELMQDKSKKLSISNLSTFTITLKCIFIHTIINILLMQLYLLVRKVMVIVLLIYSIS